MKGWEESLWGTVSEVNAWWCDDPGPFFHVLLTQGYHRTCFTLGHLNMYLTFLHIVAHTLPSTALVLCTKPKYCLKQYHLMAPIKLVSQLHISCICCCINNIQWIYMHYNSYVYTQCGTRHVIVMLYTKASSCLGVAWYYEWSIF